MFADDFVPYLSHREVPGTRSKDGQTWKGSVTQETGTDWDFVGLRKLKGTSTRISRDKRQRLEWCLVQ